MRMSITDLLNGEFDAAGNLIPPTQQAGAVRPARLAQGRRNALAVTEEAEISGAAPSATKLPIAKIRRDGGTQPRQGLNEEVLTEYGQALAEGAQFPPVDVMFDGVFYWLYDGFHRVETHLRAGRQEIEVRILHGSQSEAQWYSYAANRKHGLRRSSEDKVRAVKLALGHPNGLTLSDRQIAQHVGADGKTVAKYRKEMEVSTGTPHTNVRKGMDGKVYDTRNISQQNRSRSAKKDSNTGAGEEIPHLQNRKVEPPAMENAGAEFRTQQPERKEWVRPGRYTRPTTPPPPLDDEGFALTSWLVERVRLAVELNGISSASLREMAADPGWEFTELGNKLIAQIGQNVDFRDEDLAMAARQVANEREAAAASTGQTQAPPTAKAERPSRYVAPNYTPIPALERLVEQVVQAMKLENAAKDLRTLVTIPTWELTDLGKAIVAAAGYSYRKSDLVQAINNVADHLEQQRKATMPPPGPAPATPSPSTPRFEQEIVAPAQAKPLSQSERQAAIATELGYWEGALLHLAVVGQLTGQHTAVLLLRREIEKVMHLYRTEGGQG